MAACFLPESFGGNLYGVRVRRVSRQSTFPRRTSIDPSISAKRARGVYWNVCLNHTSIASAPFSSAGCLPTMHGGRPDEWTDLTLPVETSELKVRLARKDNTRYVAHVTVPYDRGKNRKLYVKMALTATWLRRVFADRPFSVRRARDVANATEIMSDKATVMSAVAIMEEMCRFHAHDATSVRRYTSSCVCEMEEQAPPDFDFLFANDGEGDDDVGGALFAVRVGRVAGTKVHVYASPSTSEQESRGTQRVVVFGAESDVQNTLSALVAMVDRVNGGENHATARAWALQYMADVYAGTAAACVGGDETEGGGCAWEYEGSDAKPNVIRRCEQEVTSWLEEKERRAAATAGVASYAAIVSSPPTHPPQKEELDAPASEARAESNSTTETSDETPNIVGDGENVGGGFGCDAATTVTPPVGASTEHLRPLMSAAHMNHQNPLSVRAPVFASAPWPNPQAMVSPWSNPGAAAASIMMCRGCGCYPRRVAFKPCSHLALCLLCNDVTKKNNAPCVICGAHVTERLIFYLD